MQVVRNEEHALGCILIAGSTYGLGRAAAQRLMEDEYQVVVHARSPVQASS
jgi:NAD(P)-dependent dehydrogenase (short-subunit alcohol dehydrogenase family)